MGEMKKKDDRWCEGGNEKKKDDRDGVKVEQESQESQDRTRQQNYSTDQHRGR